MRKFGRKSTIIDSPSDIPADFHFYLSDRRYPVSEGGDLWFRPLPMNRKNRNTGDVPAPMTGDYFSAAAAFLRHDKYEILRRALARQSGKETALHTIRSRNIYLVKHGEFYHPARVELVFPEKVFRFVLNVAVSTAGRDLMDRECSLLSRLNREFPHRYTPVVYGSGIGRSGDHQLPMFLGEWFEGFHEFHITVTPEGEQAIVVWDPQAGNRYLSPEQTCVLYRKASRILAEFYHPLSFEHVFPWHHAAGDFVVRTNGDDVDLRLITVRGYQSLLPDSADPDLRSILEALLVFFLIVSIRMRVDRRDGTKEPVWADDRSIPEILNGFFEGLENMPEEKTQGIPLADSFAYYLLVRDEKEVQDIATKIVEKYYTRVSEQELIRQHLDAHLAGIKQGLVDRHSGEV